MRQPVATVRSHRRGPDVYRSQSPWPMPGLTPGSLRSNCFASRAACFSDHASRDAPPVFCLRAALRRTSGTTLRPSHFLGLDSVQMPFVCACLSDGPEQPIFVMFARSARLSRYHQGNRAIIGPFPSSSANRGQPSASPLDLRSIRTITEDSAPSSGDSRHPRRNRAIFEKSALAWRETACLRRAARHPAAYRSIFDATRTVLR